MFGERRPFMTIRPGRKAAGVALAVASASAALCGCISDPFHAPVDRTSPAAGEVHSVMNQNLPYPKWSAFPAAPTGVPTAEDIRGRAQSLQTSQAETLTTAQGIQWTLSGTEAWAADARNELNPALATPAPPNSQADTQAFVDAAHAAATPPPAPK